MFTPPQRQFQQVEPTVDRTVPTRADSQKLNKTNLHQVVGVLVRCSSFWQKVGEKLGVSDNTLESLKRDVSLYNEDRMEKVLYNVHETQRGHTKTEIISALEFLGLNDIIEDARQAFDSQ